MFDTFKLYQIKVITNKISSFLMTVFDALFSCFQDLHILVINIILILLASAYDLSRTKGDNKNKTPTNRPTSRNSLSTGSKSRPLSLSLDRENKRELNDTPKTTRQSKYIQNTSKSATVAPRRIVKSGSATNITKDKKMETNQSNISKSTSLSNLKNTYPPLSVPRKSPASTAIRTQSNKLSSKYTSTPNLLDAFDSDSTSSNSIDISMKPLKSDLSNSQPDLLDDDEPQPRRSSARIADYTQRNSAGASQRSSSESRIRTSRLSLPANPPGGRSTPNSYGQKKDKDLMPPPVGPVVKGKTIPNKTTSKQDKFLNKAIQSRRKTVSELSLDQAKDILLGNSGILHAKGGSSASKTKPKRELPSTKVFASTANVVSSVTFTTTSMTTVASSSSTYTTSVYSNSGPLASSSPRSVRSDSPHTTNTSILKITSEINSLTDEIRNKSAVEAAFQNLSVLDASPNDLPERDYTPHKVQSIHHMKEHSEDEDDLASSASIRDRIAQLNSNVYSKSSTPHGSPSQTSVSSMAVSKSTPGSLSQYKQVSPSGISVSPRSSSGIGSSLDSELAAKLFSSPGGSPQSNNRGDMLHYGYTVDDNKK